MCKVTLTAGLCLIIISVVSSSKLVCYYNSLAVNRPQHGQLTVPEIDPFKCTHLIYAFADINDQHELVPKHAADIQRYHDFNQLKVRNPLLKTLLAVGGVKFNKTKFSAMVSTQENRQKFIQSAITVVRGNEFDGLNLDWRYPGASGGQPEDKERFSALCEELKVAFEAEGSTNNRDRLIIAASVSAKKEVIDAGYEVATISKYLDFISVLTFDFHDSKLGNAHHHSPLFSGPQDTGDRIFSNTDSAMQYWLGQGTPPDKLNLGLALHGRAFTLTSEIHDVGAPVRGAGDEGGYTREPGSWASYEICLYIKNNTVQLIPDQKVPFATVNHQWVGFDDKKSLEAKVSYLKAHNLGGAIVWSVDLDDFSGQFCGMGKYPFISHLNNILIAGPNDNFCAGESDGLYNIQHFPKAFYNCTHGLTKIQLCQNDLVFNVSCNCCDTPSTTTTTIRLLRHERSADLNFCYGRPDGRYNVPNEPRAFYNCGHGITHIQYCQQGLVYDKSCDCCNFPSTQTNPPDNSGTGGSVDLNFCHGRPDGRYNVPNNPGAFYNCGHGVTHIQYCQQGLVFDKSCDCCNFPSTQTNLPDNSGTGGSVDLNFCHGRPDGRYNVPNNPGAFYNCGHGVTHIQYCQQGLVYDKSCDCCNFPSTQTNLPDNSGTGGSVDLNFCHGRPDGRYNVPNNPGAFYNCGHGVTHIQYCQQGLVYDKSCDCCNFPSTQTNLPDNSGTGGSVDLNFCHGRPDGRYNVPNNPGAFYNCGHGVTHIQYCQQGLVYDKSCDCCNFPSTQTNLPDNSGTGGSVDLNFCHGRPDGRYNVPNNPGAFYNCGHGVTHIQYCQQGLVYDKSCDCCNYPSTHNTYYPTPETKTTITPTTHTTNASISTTAATTPHKTTTTPVTEMSYDQVCFGRICRYYKSTKYQRAYYKCFKDLTRIQCSQKDLISKKWCDSCNPLFTKTTTRLSSRASVSIPCKSWGRGASNVKCVGKSNGCNRGLKNLRNLFNCGKGWPSMPLCQKDLVFKKMNGSFFHPSAQSTQICGDCFTSIQYCHKDLVFILYVCHCNSTTETTSTPDPTTPPNTNTTTPPNTDNFCDGRPEGRYSVPSNPSAFYSCVNGTTQIHYCQPGFVFNESCECCKDPSTEPKATTDPNNNPGTGGSADLTFCYGRPDGLYGIPDNPGAFYSCGHGITHILLCPHGLVFRQSCECCDYPSTHDAHYNSGYDNHYTQHIPVTTTTTHYTTRPQMPTHSFCYGKTDGLYSVPNVPGAFYNCASGSTHVHYCQGGLVFKKSCDCCEHPSDETSPTPTTTKATTTTSTYYTSTTPTSTTTTYAPGTTKSHVFDDNFCYGRADGRYSVPHVPAAFYNCAYGQTYIQYCPHRLVYNPSCDCCDHSSNHYNPIPTAAATTSTHYTTTSQVFDDNFCDGRANGRYAVPNVPTAFYSCAYGETDIHYCQKGFVFKQSCYCCENPSDKTSPTPTTTKATTTTSTYYTSTTPTSTTTTYAPGTTKSHVFDDNFCYGRADGRYSVPHVPAAFYNCAYGQTYIQYCPHRLVYNPSCDCCDHSSNHYNPIPTAAATTSTHYTTTSQVFDDNFCDGRANGRYAVPNVPTAFYSCAYGETDIHYCQKGFVFKQSCYCCENPSDKTSPTPTTTKATTTTSTYYTSTTPTSTTTTYAPGTTKSHVFDDNFCYGRADGRYSVPHVPAAFYNCAYGQTYIQYCPHHLVYNPSCDCCDDSSNHYNPTTTTTTTQQPSKTTTVHAVFDDNFCQGRTDGLYSVSYSSNAFYSCSHYTTYIQFCQQGLVFQESCKCCNYP
ncbi:uncharacterized protein V6R79_012174 [Siganus canaliculatus]